MLILDFDIHTFIFNILKLSLLGCLGGSVGWASDFGSGHDLAVHGFEPRIRLWDDSSEPDAGLELTDREIVTWLKLDAQPTEPPRRP